MPAGAGRDARAPLSRSAKVHRWLISKLSCREERPAGRTMLPGSRKQGVGSTKGSLSRRRHRLARPDLSAKLNSAFSSLPPSSLPPVPPDVLRLCFPSPCRRDTLAAVGANHRRDKPDALPILAGCHARSAPRRLPRALGMVGERSRRLLGFARGIFRRSFSRKTDRDPGRRADAGHPLVSGRDAELRGARPAVG